MLEFFVVFFPRLSASRTYLVSFVFSFLFFNKFLPFEKKMI